MIYQFQICSFIKILLKKFKLKKFREEWMTIEKNSKLFNNFY